LILIEYIDIGYILSSVYWYLEFFFKCKNYVEVSVKELKEDYDFHILAIVLPSSGK